MGRQYARRPLSQPDRVTARPLLRAELILLRYCELAQRVRAHLNQRNRYEHSVRVARCADLLAHAHALDSHKARVAGMLHDLARLYAPQRLIDECAARALPIDEFEIRNPIVLHAPLGAALAQEMFGIDDPEIVSAISKHTLADAQMSPLDCALYLADGLEPGRDFPEREAFWNLALHDLHAAMNATLAASIVTMRKRDIPIASKTLAAARAMNALLPHYAQSP